MDKVYEVISEVAADGKVLVRRVSDGMVARCKPSWLEPVTDKTYQAKSKTKAIRMDGLDWVKESE